MKFVLYLLFFGLLVACLPKSPVTKACTTEARAGLSIYVKDSLRNQFLYDSLSVVASDGNYTEALQLISNNEPSFVGAWERAGHYNIVITKARYKSKSVSITVEKDECHVIAQSYTAQLSPIK